jgi:hypothetical protein
MLIHIKTLVHKIRQLIKNVENLIIASIFISINAYDQSCHITSLVSVVQPKHTYKYIYE